MADQPDLTYDVTITITLPGRARPISLSITLAPADRVATVDGKVKALQDCTLGELQQFADQVEADVVAAYESATLVDLALDDQVQVKIEAPAAEGNGPSSDQLWLQHAVVYPAKSRMAAAEPQEVLSSVEEDGDQKEAGSSLEATVEPAQEEGGPPEVKDDVEEEIGAEPEPTVKVSDTLPVREEREAAAALPADGEVREREVEVPVPGITRPRIRILGRRRPLNHPTWTAVDILMNEPAFRDTQAHAISSPDKEVAGVLVGPQPEKQPDGRYIVHVTDMIIAKHTRMHGASVTYTPESWRYVNDKLNALYPDDTAVIVGWYHTHPGFGIFLSGMDLFIHHNFFTQLWHIAMVLDPVARRTGFFCWDRPMGKVDKYDFPWPEWALGSW